MIKNQPTRLGSNQVYQEIVGFIQVDNLSSKAEPEQNKQRKSKKKLKKIYKMIKVYKSNQSFQITLMNGLDLMTPSSAENWWIIDNRN